MAWKSIILATTALAVAAVAIVGTVAWLYDRDTIVQETGKSPAEMRRLTSLPFPADSSHIHYFLRSGGLQDHDTSGKFECPAHRADEILADFIASNDRLMGSSPGATPARRTLTTPPFGITGTNDLKIPWWNLDESKIGKAILLDRSQAMQFWLVPGNQGITTIYFHADD